MIIRYSDLSQVNRFVAAFSHSLLGNWEGIIGSFEFCFKCCKHMLHLAILSRISEFIPGQYNTCISCSSLGFLYVHVALVNSLQHVLPDRGCHKNSFTPQNDTVQFRKFILHIPVDVNTIHLHWRICCTFLPKNFTQNQGCGLSARTSTKARLDKSAIFDTFRRNKLKTILATHSVTYHKKLSNRMRIDIFFFLQVWWLLKEPFLF